MTASNVQLSRRKDASTESAKRHCGDSGVCFRTKKLLTSSPLVLMVCSPTLLMNIYMYSLSL